MPARRERLIVCPVEGAAPGRVLDWPLWWDRRGLLERYRSREVDTGNPWYVDFAILLTGGEARAFDEACRAKHAQEAQGPTGAAHLEARMREVAEALAEAEWVVLESREWESGLD